MLSTKIYNTAMQNTRIVNEKVKKRELKYSDADLLSEEEKKRKDLEANLIGSERKTFNNNSNI